MMNKMLCHENQSLLEALSIINVNGKGTAFIVDTHHRMKGVLTDGDIRRLLLKGVKLEEKSGIHANANFTSGKPDEAVVSLLSKTNDKIKIIPLIDDEGVVQDLFIYENSLYLPVAAPNLKGKEFDYLVDAFLSTWISSSGAYIDRFEEAFSAYCQTSYGVATANGSVSIHLALTALGIGAGDEVILPDLTFAATINAVILTGATPVLVDVEEDSWCIDPAAAKAAITPATKAIIPVHLYGQACDMDAIMAIAKQYHLKIVEDCAEAHGASCHGQKVGSFGDIGTYSFFANKIITTGEGGMCVTNSPELNEKMRVLRDHGMNKTKRYWHDEVGFNYRMTNLQASIGVAQLERIDAILAQRRAIEDSYRKYLGDLPMLQFQTDFDERSRVVWLVSALITDGKRECYVEEARKQGVDIRKFFYSLGEMPVFASYHHSSAVSRKLSQQGINFPSVEPLSDTTATLIRNIFKGQH